MRQPGAQARRSAALGSGAGRRIGGQSEHDSSRLRAADAEGLLERRHGDGTFVADRVPTGQMRAQRELLRQQIARVAELAKTLGVEPEELHQLLEQTLNQGPKP